MRTLLLCASLAAACGGGDEESGEPLLAGSLTGEYDGTAFTAEFGFATVYQQQNLIALGDGPIHCGSEDDRDPPSGFNVALSLPAFAADSYTSVFVQLYRNEGSFEGVGSNQGSVTLSAVSESSIAGSVEYDYTDDDGRHFAVSGTFEVVRCAP